MAIETDGDRDGWRLRRMAIETDVHCDAEENIEGSREDVERRRRADGEVETETDGTDRRRRRSGPWAWFRINWVVLERKDADKIAG